MKPDLRKIWVVASTEFGSAIRTKSFIIGLLLLPVIMGASILIQVFVAARVDTKPRKFVVIDHTGALYAAIEQAAEAHNARLPEARGKNARPPLEPEPAGRMPDAGRRRGSLPGPRPLGPDPPRASSMPTSRSPRA